MMFLVHANFAAETIEGDLGKEDYSYYFVLRSYVPVLQALGTVVELRDPHTEADVWHSQCAARGEYCVLLAFSPPHRIPMGLRCPVVPVFAWEYDSIPDESWRHDRETDWSRILALHGRAITHSEFAVSSVRGSIRADFPIVSIPAPVWDRYTCAAARDPLQEPGAARKLVVQGAVLDSRVDDLRADDAELLRACAPREQELTLDGVVYTAIFCPMDGRKNWEDLVTAFCWAFRDKADCTLVLKLVHHDREEAIAEVLLAMRRLPRCLARILVVHAFLDDEQYGQLVRGSDFIVNSSLGEGQCLPLMEFMSAGVPAIAPGHTAMLDYLDDTCGFVVRAFPEWCNWPQDLREMLRTRRHRPEWESLMSAYVASRELRLLDPPAYWRMSQQARGRQRRHCSQDVARAKLLHFFRAHARSLQDADHQPQLPGASGAVVGEHFPARSGLVGTFLRDKLRRLLFSLRESALLRGANLRADPRASGLSDMVRSGWCNAAAGELFGGFAVGVDDTVLDVGCGDGLAVTFCAQQGAHVDFCDIDPDKIRALGRHLDERGLTRHAGHVVRGDRLPFADASMSRVIATEVLEHVDDPRALLMELVRVGKPGAKYLISVPDAACETFQMPFASAAYFAPPNHVRI
ncbi:MAG: methyltransferase domain-containing protein, partial [Pseudomonadales bacterium]